MGDRRIDCLNNDKQGKNNETTTSWGITTKQHVKTVTANNVGTRLRLVTMLGCLILSTLLLSNAHAFNPVTSPLLQYKLVNICRYTARGCQSTRLHAFLPRFTRSLVKESEGGDGNDNEHVNDSKSKSANNTSLLQDEEEDPTAVLNSGSSDTNISAGSKLRRLKDLMWVRETLEDLTAAEFACTVESTSSAHSDEGGRSRRKRAVDYEKLLGQLNRRLFDMGCEGTDGGGSSASSSASASSSSLPNKQRRARVETTDNTADDTLVCKLKPGVGMGSIVYTQEQRSNLLERILRIRLMLLEVMRGNELELEEEKLTEKSANKAELPFSISLPELRVEIPREQDEKSAGPKLYVRDDGTVDWDGALQDQAALRKFGNAVWARINGRDPETIEGDEDGNSNAHAHGGGKQEVTARIEETPQIVQARQRLDELKADARKRESEHTGLLASAIREGQAVANVKLAALEPEQRNRIRASAEALALVREKVTHQTQVYELERIYTYLMREIGNPALKGYIPLQDRLNVAEFGLLESQIDNFNRQLEAGDGVDADVLAVVMDQLTDFKRRLGIDYYVTGLSFDGEAIRRWLAELLEKTKKGLAFYVKGVQLFWNDIVFCLRLINRAAQGYTLKPREVRYIR